jgi:hypothetical protein
MARIRTIKPEFWTSEQIVECSTNARLLFIGIWNFADDGGVIPDSWKRLKMQVFPGDDFNETNMKSLIDELVSQRLLMRFYHENNAYLQVKGWHHQKIERPNYKFPQPDENTKFDDHSTTDRRQIGEQSPPEGNGREWKGEEGSGKEMSAQSSGRSDSPYTEDFERFWGVYPSTRKTKKGDAFKSWRKAIKLESPEYLILKAAEYAASEVGRGMYAVMPSVWLNGRCWEDAAETWNPSTKKAATFSDKTQQTLRATELFINGTI